MLPNHTELERVADRVRAVALPVEQTGEGLLVHDPSQNGVVLTDRTDLRTHDGSVV